jgi:hypothetical protein
MMSLVIQVLATYALWYGLTQSNLPLWGSIRDWLTTRYEGWSRFFNCALCSGFWCSLAVALIRSEVDLYAWEPWRVIFPLALAGAGGCFLIETLVTRLETR